MPLIPGKDADLNQGVEPKRPLFERIQDWIFRLDVGFGVQWFRLGLFCVLVIVVIGFYHSIRFLGLRDREAMDIAQLARNLSRGNGYVTQFVRPLDVWYLHSIGRPSLEAGRNSIPELWTPPLYPMTVAAVFRGIPPRSDLTQASKVLELPPQQLPSLEAGNTMGLEKLLRLYEIARNFMLRMDRTLVLVAWLFFMVGLAIVYLLARDVFDHRVAVLSVFLYLFCDPLLDDCIAGLPTAFLSMLFMLATYGIFKAEKWAEAGKSNRWIYGALTAAALAVGLGTLTQYSFASILIPLLVYVGVSFRARGWQGKVALCLGVFVIVLVPWVARNWRVSQTLFGLSRFELSEGLRLNYQTEIKPGQLQRVYGIGTRIRPAAVVKKLFLNSRELYEKTLKDIGSNYLIAFFLASLLHRFRRDEVFRLRRLIFWTLLTCVLWLGLAGPSKHNPLTMFFPLIIIYGCAFFFVMFERLQFRRRWERRAFVGMFAVLNVLPFLYTILPPARTSPYPPYDSGVIAAVGNTFREDEIVATDMPWAMAWYADKTALWAPFDRADYLAINDEIRSIAGIFVTPVTPMSMTVNEAWAGYQSFWTRVYQPPPRWQSPDAFFDSYHWRPLTMDGMHVLLVNRPRWPVER